jgi:crotonobetainyl-CoA:carnitine CoA-transferase CaiB-like acyl-CoA transferase
LTDTPLPLTGLKVIDITHARAGPTAVRHLADWGADVIRVEPPLAPAGSPANEDVIGKERGSDYQNMHRNKRSIRLDLKDPAGLAVFMDLVKSADVLVENMRPQVKHRLGIAYEQLREINPRLVYGSISGFGQTGPYRDRPGLDQIAQGMTGLMSVTGEPDGPPLRTGIAVGDLTAGNMLALNIMMALYQRERTGAGSWVHTSLVESLLFMLDFQTTRWLVDREVPHRVGNDHPTAIPIGVFATTDGHITLAAASSRMWARLCETLHKPEWALKEEWLTRDRRRVHKAEIHAAIGEVIRTQSTQHWIEILNKAGVTCGPIYTMDQVFEDEQVKQLGMALPVEHPHLGPLKLLASPMNFEGVTRSIRRPTPDGGADSGAILRGLGYSASRIDELRAAGVC